MGGGPASLWACSSWAPWVWGQTLRPGLAVSFSLKALGLHGMGLLGPWPPARAGPGSLCVLGTCGQPCGLCSPRRWLLSGHRIPTAWSADPGPQAGGGTRLVASSAAFDLGAQQLAGGGASPPARLVPPVTNSRTPRGPAGHMVSALCPFTVLGEGRGEQNRTFGGTSKVQFSNQKEFPSFPLMFCLCVVLGFK